MKRYVFILFLIIVTFAVQKGTTSGDMPQMINYCYSPPSIAQNVKPNVLFVMDFSGSMQFPTYVGCNHTGYSNYVAQCGTHTVSSSTEWRYDTSKTYSGYFEPNKCYEYSSSSFQEKSCNCSNKIGTSSCISGNLLNWITTTRIDIARKVLTGGRSSSSGGNTFLESEGAEYTINDENLKCKFTISANVTTNRSITIENYNGTCPLGNKAVQNANIQIKASDPNSIKGIIHDFCDTSDLNGQINEKCKLIMEFMVFASNNRDGVIRVGKNATISNLISAINNETPYYGTPTGEALWEAYDYYKQSNDHTYESNSAYINRGNGNVDPYYDGSGSNSSPVWCRKSFVLLLSDGAWNGNIDPVIPARVKHVEDLRSDLPGKQTVETYAIYAFGDLEAGTKLEGRQAIITTAIFGGFEIKQNDEWPYPFTSYPQSSRKITYPLPECNPSGTWNNLCSEWDTFNNSPKDGLPFNFYEADDAESLKAAIFNALVDILRRASSGATVATLTSKTGFSSLIIQPYYYPRYQTQEGTELSWLGFLRSIWIDMKQNLREDSFINKILDILGSSFDKIVKFITAENETKIAVLKGDTEVGPDACTVESIKELNQLIPVFDASCKLAATDASIRNIKYNSGSGLVDFKTDQASFLRSIWQAVDSNINSDEKSECIIRYLRGENVSNNPTCSSLPNIKRAREINFSTNQVCSGLSGTKTWKLADIIHSTPSVVSNEPVNIYHKKYNDITYQEFINSSGYRNRPAVVFVGANDGMLHAFRVGTIVNQASADQPAKLQNAPNDTGTDKIGQEEWAFIPRNALPYLAWYGRQDYCHVPTVDYRTMVVDAKIDGSWKTLLVGVMGFGGKAIPESNPQYSSSIFVLDITDPLNPSLRWERALDDKTLTLSFPAVVKVGDNWYVVAGTGPKEPQGTSFTTAKLYFFNLNNGTNAREPITISSGLNAAVGDLMPSDVDLDYSDDVIYFGTYTTNSGDFYRLVIKNGIANAQLSKAMNVSRPIFAAPTFTKDEDGNFWVFFGTGRFLGDSDKTIGYTNYLVGFKDPCWNGSCSNTYNVSALYNSTNFTMQGIITAIKQVCNCSAASCGLVDVAYKTTPISSMPNLPERGWRYEFNNPKEAIVSQPIVYGGILDALSFEPSGDICIAGGTTNLLALHYKYGVANPQPAIYSTLAVQGNIAIGETVIIKPKVLLGYGVPPLGNPFQISASQTGEIRKFIQISTGFIYEIPQKGTGGGRFISWIEK